MLRIPRIFSARTKRGQFDEKYSKNQKEATEFCNSYLKIAKKL